MKTEDVDKLVDNIASMIKLGIRHVVESAKDAEVQAGSAWDSVKTTVGGCCKTAERSPALNFHLGEWRRFSEDGEAYQIVSPLRQDGSDWIMRIHLKDGSTAEYPLSQIESNPPLTGE